MRYLAIIAIIPAGASLYFFVFWRWFGFWRRHWALTYLLMTGTFAALGTGAWLGRAVVLAGRLDLPPWVTWIGWAVIALSIGFALVANHQLGVRVRAFVPFFEEHGRIELVTTGAFAVVRHPLYAGGVVFQLGALLVTGYPAIAGSAAVLAAGAVWFTRQEERRLLELLDDPAAYERYRARVPALLPWPRPRRPRPQP